MTIGTPEMEKFIDTWHNTWKKWKSPYDTIMWAWPVGAGAKTLVMDYWMIDVVERAGSTDPEKIIKTLGRRHLQIIKRRGPHARL